MELPADLVVAKSVATFNRKLEKIYATVFSVAPHFSPSFPLKQTK